MEFINPLIVILILNSFLIIGLILNQNEVTKSTITAQSSSSAKNPIEQLTWVSLILQLNLLLIKIKINDF